MWCLFRALVTMLLFYGKEQPVHSAKYLFSVSLKKNKLVSNNKCFKKVWINYLFFFKNPIIFLLFCASHFCTQTRGGQVTFRLKMPLNNKEPILLLYRLLSHTFHFSSAEHKSSKSLLLPEPQKQLTCPAKKHTHTQSHKNTHRQ